MRRLFITSRVTEPSWGLRDGVQIRPFAWAIVEDAQAVSPLLDQLNLSVLCCTIVEDPTVQDLWSLFEQSWGHDFLVAVGTAAREKLLRELIPKALNTGAVADAITQSRTDVELIFTGDASTGYVVKGVRVHA